MYAPGNFPIRLWRFQLQPHVNPANYQYVIFQLDLTCRFRHKTLVRCIDVTRLQRASKGSDKSTGRRGNNVVERRRMRFEHRGRHLVMLSHRAVDAEDYGFRFCRQIRSAHRSFYPFDPDM